MRHYVLTIVWITSLLFCVGVCALWLRSYFASDEVNYFRGMLLAYSDPGPLPNSVYHPPMSYSVVTARGEIGLMSTVHFFLLPPRHWSHGSGPPQQVPIVAARGAMGFYADGWRLQEQTTWELDANGNSPLTNSIVATSSPIGNIAFRYVFVPFWFLLALAVMPAALGKAASYRSRRRALGLCVRCGYDLRASSGRCPECGASSAKPG